MHAYIHIYTHTQYTLVSYKHKHTHNPTHETISIYTKIYSNVYQVILFIIKCYLNTRDDLLHKISNAQILIV